MSATHPLEGTGALVTGGGSGIGLACAVRLATDGATVTICGRTAERLTSAIDETGPIDGPGSLHAIAADVTDEAAMAAAVQAAEANAGGPLGIVVANAGGSTSIGPVTQLGRDEWDATTAVILTGTMLALKYGAASLVRGGGGSFVAISSTAGSLVHPWFGAYGPAKAAVNQLCRQAADELGPSAVRVNSVCPGLIRTEMVEMITAGGGVLDSYEENTPIDRIGEPDDIAAMVRFLVGPESTWLTGQVITVDGGQSLRRGPSLAEFIEPLFGADGLRGVVGS
ncbi:SDR family oxidoreductase [Aquihabitans sp. McL0605]|uniref:SDR family oxidoreductase n=1 Tax=Aquihabitans sp. McL0605 TaxID=3415671 RepID=UPI003CEF9C6C